MIAGCVAQCTTRSSRSIVRSTGRCAHARTGTRGSRMRPRTCWNRRMSAARVTDRRSCNTRVHWLKGEQWHVYGKGADPPVAVAKACGGDGTKALCTLGPLSSNREPSVWAGRLLCRCQRLPWASPSDEVCITAPESVISVECPRVMHGRPVGHRLASMVGAAGARGSLVGLRTHTPLMTAWHDQGATAGRSSGVRAQRRRGRIEGIISQVMHSEGSGISYNVDAWAAATITSRRKTKAGQGHLYMGGVEAF